MGLWGPDIKIWYLCAGRDALLESPSHDCSVAIFGCEGLPNFLDSSCHHRLIFIVACLLTELRSLAQRWIGWPTMPRSVFTERASECSRVRGIKAHGHRAYCGRWMSDIFVRSWYNGTATFPEVHSSQMRMSTTKQLNIKTMDLPTWSACQILLMKSEV